MMWSYLNEENTSRAEEELITGCNHASRYKLNHYHNPAGSDQVTTQATGERIWEPVSYTHLTLPTILRV